MESASAPGREEGPPGGLGVRVWMQRKEGWCPLQREGSSSAVTEAGTGGQGVGPMGGSHVRAVAAGPGAQVQAEAALVLDTV